MMRATPLLAALALLGACHQGGRDQASAESALRAANAQYDKALVDGDAAALERYYTDDFQRFGNDGQVHGKKDQIAAMTREVDLREARSDEVTVTMLGRDSALVTGRVSGRYRYRGKDDDFTERFTSVWVRDGDRWRVRHEHASLLPRPREGQSG